MDVDAVISFADLAKEILKEMGFPSEGQDDIVRVLRKKYAFLFNNVIVRSKLDFKLKGKDMIPWRDKPIVKELIARSYYPQCDRDKLVVDWFNDSIAANDYEKIRDLGSWIDSIISDELYNNNLDIDEVTRDEWIAAIHSAIRFDLALSVLLTTEMLEALYSNLTVLDHRIPFGDMIKGNEFGARVYQWKGYSAHLYSSQPFDESLKTCYSLENYFSVLRKILYQIGRDASEKTALFIKAYAKLKAMSGFTSADQLLTSDSLASEYSVFFQNIYDYLKADPNLTERIEQETGTNDLLSFFKMKDRNHRAK